MFDKFLDKIQHKIIEKDNKKFDAYLENQKETYRTILLNKYKNVMINDRFQEWVDEDEKRTIEAVNKGKKYWLWDTQDFAEKLYLDAVNMCQVFPQYKDLALYVATIAKFITDEEVVNVFKRWFYTGEIEYRKEFFGVSIYMNAHYLQEHPLTALFLKYSIETGEIPYPAHLSFNDLYVFAPIYSRNLSVYCKKISDNNLHLIDCSKDEYAKVLNEYSKK